MSLLLDSLNPCTLCNRISTVILLVFGIVIGGYCGKFYYLYGSPDMEPLNWKQILTSDGFWSPDWIFWTFGLLTIVSILFIVFLIDFFFKSVWHIFRAFMCFIICCNTDACSCCCNNRHQQQKNSNGYLSVVVPPRITTTSNTLSSLEEYADAVTDHNHSTN